MLFVSGKLDWKYVGVTHEYITCGDQSNDFRMFDGFMAKHFYDGGSRGDKFERDIRMLEEAIKEEPDNARYMFYLAQSYRDTNQHDLSIKYYKKRVEAGGWNEEVFYSMYMLCKNYAAKEDYNNMEYWGNKAYEYRRCRLESIYFLTKKFRELGQHYKAWHYYLIGVGKPKPNDLLFVENKVYEFLFKYEKTILSFYIKNDGLRDVISFYNQHNYNKDNVYSNIQWYVKPIPCEVKELDYPKKGDYIPSSISILKKDGYLLNVRYVNYRILEDGSYTMVKNGKESKDNLVKTKNFMAELDENFNKKSGLIEMIEEIPNPKNTKIRGLEDVRLYQEDGNIKCIAMTHEYSYNNKIRQIIGNYDIKNKKINNSLCLKPPKETECEKNWIPYKIPGHFIYTWEPFQIGKVVNDKLEITHYQETEPIFSKFRGSSNIVEKDDYYWTIVHSVLYTKPRKYWHYFIKIDKETHIIKQYSLPFYFINNSIEYCLGLEIKDDKAYAFVSCNDSSPKLITFHLSDINYINL
jgi:hypothetical protein